MTKADLKLDLKDLKNEIRIYAEDMKVLAKYKLSAEKELAKLTKKLKGKK